MIRMSLFISNFRLTMEERIKKVFKYKKKIKTMLVLGLTIGLVAVICKLLNYLYVTPDNFSRVLFHNYYEEKENIDYLYLGSSHLYCGINPYLLDEINDGYNYNLGTSMQLLNSSYHLLREADKKHDIKQVFVEMYYSCSTGGDYTSRIWTNWRVTDYMKPSWNRLSLMLRKNSSENYLETFLPFIRYRSKLFDVNHIVDNIKAKQEENYKKYRYITENSYGMEAFYGKGYCMRDWELQESLIMDSCTMSEEPMLEEAEEYLRKIIEYCQKNEIEITLFSAPMYEVQLLSVDDYDAYVNQVNDIAEEYGISYYDFNLCKEELLSIQDKSYFSDIGHLNPKGSEIFTKVFWKVMQGDPEENRTLFYDTYMEKRKMTEAKVYGVIDNIIVDKEPEKRYLKVASNRENDMEYRIVITPNGGESRMFQDFSENAIFYVPTSEEGICTIVARDKEENDKIQTIEVEY